MIARDNDAQGELTLMGKKRTLAQIAANAPGENEAVEMLRKTCAGAGQIVLAQVRNATGASYRVRTADALIVETWPSRGMGFTGVEYKKYRYDWLKELKEPGKADEIAQYCQHWLILAPAGLVQAGELPTNWGLWEIKGKRIYRTVKAPLLEYIDPTVSFVCAMLRANRDIDPSLELIFEARRLAREELEKEHEKELDAMRDNHRKLQDAVRKFQDETGLSLHWNLEGSIEVANELLRYLKYPKTVDDKLETIRAELMQTVKTIDGIRGKT